MGFEFESPWSSRFGMERRTLISQKRQKTQMKE